jgi:two-component system KDP operon response regulator KdpE
MKKKILIIDDNKDLQDMFRIYFEAADYLVYISADGMQGITSVLDLSPDVVLLDLMMPHMNGFEVLQTIRDYSSIRIPVIVCSSLAQESDIRRAYEL